jgi:hypothetical protein
MQILKCFVVVCAAAYCAVLLPLRAADADTQNKLQEALEKKLNELQTQPATAAPQPAVTAPVAAPAVSAPSAADSDAIAKAREALRQKMTELQTPSGGRPTPPAQWAPAPVARPVPAVAQPAAPASAPAVQPAPKPVLTLPPAADSDAIAKAREALRQKMTELQAQPVSQPAPAAKPLPVAAQPVFATPPAVKTAPVAAQPVVAPTPAETENIAKAREVLRKKMQELETQPPVVKTVPAPAPMVAQPKPVEKPVVEKSISVKAQETAVKPDVKPKTEKLSAKPAKGLQPFQPIQGPPLSISADKQERLAELLRKYRADEITPEEYHQQRAKILAEP